MNAQQRGLTPDVVAVGDAPTVAELRSMRRALVPRGLGEPLLVVARADGAHVWDADGREYIDFAGGIGCQNLGHNPPVVVRALERQLARYSHQCAVISTYDVYQEVCERLASLWPGKATPIKTLLLSTGAEAVENAVKVARAATGRRGVVVFDRAFHGRTNLTMAMTAKAVYKRSFGPLGTEVYRAPAPYPYRGITTADALDGLRRLFMQDVDPIEVACVVIEPVQGEGGYIPMPREFVRPLRALCAEHGILFVDDEIQSGCGRTGTVWAIEQLEVEPDLLISGKSLGGGLPLAAVSGRAELMDAVHPGGLGGTFAGNPLSCAAAVAILDEIATAQFALQATELAAALSSALERIAATNSIVGEVRGLGTMLALELTEPTPDRAQRVVDAALERGLVILSCGLYGNVIRLLPPLTINNEDLLDGLAILEASLEEAAAA
jgi:4-aminobutyrate aminotransferase/(S)-3-amino-2-methylpropionate transaminase